MNYIKFNNLTVPVPSRGLNIKRIPQISTATTADGRTVAQLINERALYTLGDISWAYLTAEQWKSILSEISNPEGYITFFDEIKQKYVKLKVLFTQSYEEPFIIDADGKPVSYVNCQCTVSDMGYAVVELDGE